MNNLSIQLIVNPQCQLVAIDNTRYFNLTTRDGDIVDSLMQHVSLEFLVYCDEKDPIDSTIVFKEYCHNRSEYGQNISIIDFPKDGTFTYYKFVIPTLDHLIKPETGEIKLMDQVFYWNRKFYIGLKDISIEGEDIINTYKSEILSSSKELDSFLDIWEYIKQGQATQTFSFQNIIFSVCKLQYCLVTLQKKMLLDTKTCLSCDESKDLKYKRDFLLSALYVLDYLKDRKNYDEAQRILDNLSSCNGLCDEGFETTKDCGCGSTK